MKAEAIAAIIVGACLLGCGLYARHEKARADKLAGELAAAAAAEQACSASIAELDAQAREREEAAAKALAEAQAAADKYALRADRILKTPAAVQGDDCASAQVRARAWLEGRQ